MSTTSSLSSDYFKFNLTTVSYLFFPQKIIIVFTLYLLLNLLLKMNFLVQSRVLGRIFAWSRTNSSARNCLECFSPILSLARGEVMRSELNKHHQMQVALVRNHNRTMQIMGQKAEQVWMVHREILQNPITVDKDEGSSETKCLRKPHNCNYIKLNHLGIL